MKAFYVSFFSLILFLTSFSATLIAQQSTTQKLKSCLYQEGVKMADSKSVTGGTLQICSTETSTGFYRNGKCDTGTNDYGVHAVCAEMTTDFLNFTKQKGNDLSTPFPLYGFPGLKAGDKWCLCASRWKEAHQAGVAPVVDLAATHQSALKYATYKELNSKTLSKK